MNCGKKQSVLSFLRNLTEAVEKDADELEEKVRKICKEADDEVDVEVEEDEEEDIELDVEEAEEDDDVEVEEDEEEDIELDVEEAEEDDEEPTDESEDEEEVEETSKNAKVPTKVKESIKRKKAKKIK